MRMESAGKNVNCLLHYMDVLYQFYMLYNAALTLKFLPSGFLLSEFTLELYRHKK